MTHAVTMVAMMKFDVQFNVRVNVLRRFASEIRKQYKENPYHNFRHGVDVMQSVFWMSRKIDFERHLPSVEMFSLLTEALSHDVGHAGVNNALLVNTSGGSGTRVTCAGLTSQTKATKSLLGYPSMLNSVLTTDFSARTSS